MNTENHLPGTINGVVAKAAFTNTLSRTLWGSVLALCTMVFILTGSSLKGRHVVTERQECELIGLMLNTGEFCPLTISVDVPVSGSRRVIDSIVVFLNESLYAYFDDGMDHHIPYERVYSRNPGRLISDYWEAYAPFFPGDSIDVHEFNSDCLEVNLAAQTDDYVTYEIDRIFFGEGIETEMEWVTFSKADGHRLTEILSGRDLFRFYRDHPEHRNAVIWEDVLYRLRETDGADEITGCIGLLVDSIAHQYVFAPGIFEDVRYPLGAVAPYLSRKVQVMTTVY